MSKETIGSRIKAFRKGRGITQAELAKSLGHSHKSVITHIEKGESEMSYEKIKEGEKEEISKMATYNPNEEW